MKDFARFLMVVCAVLAGLLLGWFGLYTVSQNPHRPSQPTPLVASLLAQTPFQISNSSQNPATFRHLVAEYRQDDWWVGTETLLEVLQAQPASTVFLEPLTLQSSHLAKLKTLLEPQDLWKKIVFLSRSDAILKDLRELAPQWSFGTGEVFLARFLSLSGLKLSGLLKVPGDVFYVTNHRQLHEDEAENIILAGLQQNKLVIFASLNGHYASKKQTAKILNKQQPPQ